MNKFIFFCIFALNCTILARAKTNDYGNCFVFLFTNGENIYKHIQQLVTFDEKVDYQDIIKKIEVVYKDF